MLGLSDGKVDRPGKGVGIAGGVEEGLALGGHLLEDLLGRRRRGRRRPTSN